MAVGDHLGALGRADERVDRGRVGCLQQELELVDVAGARQVALAHIARVPRRTGELAWRADVEDDEPFLAESRSSSSR